VVDTLEPTAATVTATKAYRTEQPFKRIFFGSGGYFRSVRHGLLPKHDRFGGRFLQLVAILWRYVIGHCQVGCGGCRGILLSRFRHLRQLNRIISYLRIDDIEGDVHAHYGTCTSERTGSVLRGYGFGRDQTFGGSGKPGSIGLS
jgi:hypothetical protein